MEERGPQQQAWGEPRACEGSVQPEAGPPQPRVLLSGRCARPLWPGQPLIHGLTPQGRDKKNFGRVAQWWRWEGLIPLGKPQARLILTGCEYDHTGSPVPSPRPPTSEPTGPGSSLGRTSLPCPCPPAPSHPSCKDASPVGPLMLVLSPWTPKGVMQGEDAPVQFHLGWWLPLLKPGGRNAGCRWSGVGDLCAAHPDSWRHWPSDSRGTPPSLE